MLRLLVALTILALPAPESFAQVPDLTEDLATVERIRGLEFVEPVIQERVTIPELREFLQGIIDEELGMSPEEYVLSLRALGVLEPEVDDPIEALLDLYTSQVLAFYDTHTGRFYVVEQAASQFEMPGMDSMVRIHELTHALQDQRFRAGERIDEALDDWDRLTAIQAILEGEATLVMLASVVESVGATLDDLLDELDVSQVMGASLALGGLTDAPPYFVQSMLFPYVSGLEAVIHAYRDAGWDGVDRLYADTSPTASEIYDTSLALDPAPLELEPAGNPILDTRLGEFHWRFFVGEEAARGWRNDRAIVSSTPDGAMVQVSSVWENEHEAREFERALREKLAELELPGAVAAAGSVTVAVWSWNRSGTPVVAGTSSDE